jgi:hypothetical protein
MRIHVFVPRKAPNVLSLTLNQTVDNLPTAPGPWYPVLAVLLSTP